MLRAVATPAREESMPKKKPQEAQEPGPSAAHSEEGDTRVSQPADAADNETSTEGKSWSLPDPRHTIDVGDGRTAQFTRINRWKQLQIRFTAPEGQDPNPGPAYTAWLK